MKRRNFLKNSSAAIAGLAATPIIANCEEKKTEKTSAYDTLDSSLPLAIATWNVPNATAKAWEVLKDGGNALDAVEQGVMVEEADVNNQSVGKGGRPDRDGKVTLDACIMDKDSNCGAVRCTAKYYAPYFCRP